MDILNGSKGPESVSPTVREKIARRFENWLDEVLENEMPLEGLDLNLFSELDKNNPSSHSISQKKDYFSNWAALTALTQEVRLQGRAFWDLSGKVDPLSTLAENVENVHAKTRETLDETRKLTSHAEDLFTNRENEIEREALKRSKNAFLETFLDIRERLYAGLASTGEARKKLVEKEKTGWFGGDRRVQGLQSEAAAIISSLKKGYEMSIERLDEVLLKHGVSEISCRGIRFDPETMNAVDVEERDDMPDGTVIAVYRRGYTMENELHRPAQVKVSKAPREAGSLEK